MKAPVKTRREKRGRIDLTENMNKFENGGESDGTESGLRRVETAVSGIANRASRWLLIIVPNPSEQAVAESTVETVL